MYTKKGHLECDQVHNKSKVFALWQTQELLNYGI